MNQEFEVTGPGLIENISAFIRRFVKFDDESLYFLVSLWVLSTYLTDTFQYAGYLCVHSVIPGSGKSRLLEVLELLVHNPYLYISPTEAVIFHTAKGRTQLLDEADGWHDKGEAVRSVLNSGFSKGKLVTRMKRTGNNGNYGPEQFDVFGPKAIAGVNINNILHRSTLERTFAIELTKRKPSERGERFRPKILQEVVATLHQQIQDWVQDSATLSAIEQLYDHVEGNLDYLEALEDRTLDISEPLACILEVAYQDSDQIGQMRQTLKEAILITRKADRDTLRQVDILKQLASLAEADDPLIGNATELHARCNGLAGEITQNDITRALRDHGFVSKSIRLNGEPKKRYSLNLEDLKEIINLYA